VVEVAVPPTGRVSVTYVAERAGSAAGVRYPPVPGWKPAESRDPFVRPEAREQLYREGAAYAAAEPAPQVRLLGLGVERGLRIARILVSPVSWDPTSGRATWSSNVTFRVGVEGGGAPAPARHKDRAARAAWGRRLVNPADADRWTKAREAETGAGIPRAWFDDAPGWVKIRIDANGVYALDRDALAGLGVPVESLDPRTFRLFCGSLRADVGYDTTRVGTRITINPRWRHVDRKTGFVEGFGAPPDTADGRFGMDEVAVWVPGEEDGSFDSGDRVVFYALGPDNFADRFGDGNDRSTFRVNPYTSETVYWLTWEASFDGSPRRMETVDTTPGSGTPLVETNARVHFEGNTWYDPSMYLAGFRWEEWFWERMSNVTGATIKILRFPGLVPGTTMDGTVRLWGANRPTGTGDGARHNVRIDAGDQLLDTVAWGEGGNQFHPFDVPFHGVPLTDPLRMRFEVLDLGGIDLVHLAWINAVYRRSLDAGGGPFEFELPAAAAGSPVEIAAPPSDPVLFDVSDVRRPRRLTGAVLDGGSALRFQAPGDGTYVLTAPDRYATPAGVVLDTRPDRWLRDTSEPLDYVIVAFDDFVPEGEELAAWRRNHLGDITDTREAHVRVVRISDIYDEFSAGMVDPAAIRYFLEYAYRFYGSENDDPLSYCLFLGDHTYDTRDHLGSGNRDQVPSWEDNRVTLAWLIFGNVQYVTDDPLARFDGPLDRSTDLYLGRITAESRAELRPIIENKVLRSEQSPPRGPWRARVILVADDVCQGRDEDSIGFSHMVQTEAVSASMDPAFDRDKIYLWEYGEECVVDTKPAAKAALLASWSRGAWAVNYIGHGADVVLADEHVFDQVDIPLLGNDGKFPVFGAFSCSVGKFSKPLTIGLGEGLSRAPRGGALVCAVATSLTGSGSNAALNRVFYEQMFPQGPTDPAPIGVALMNAKRISGGESDKYVCLGDPASRPSVPERTLNLQGPEALERGSRVKLTVDLDGGETGLLDVVARDAQENRPAEYTRRNGFVSSITYKRTGSVLFRGESEISGPRTDLGFVVPMSLRDGNDGKVRVYGWGED